MHFLSNMVPSEYIIAAAMIHLIEGLHIHTCISFLKTYQILVDVFLYLCAKANISTICNANIIIMIHAT